MRTLYIECAMGAAGDMLTAALLELSPDREGFLRTMNSLMPGKVEVTAETAVKCGINGTQMRVRVNGEEEHTEDVHGHHHHEHEHHHHDHEHEHHHDHEHHHEHHHSHTSLAEIEALIMSFELPEKVREDAAAVYRLIAEAESHAHGKPVGEIHFHEVGTLDAVADVVGVCLLIHQLAPERISASPVHVGSGHVRCAHGVLPVPAPATEYILRGIPTYGGAVEGELCTPTGAALLRHFVSEFGEMPLMRTENTGYGMGRKDFPMINCVRAFLGDSGEVSTEQVCELVCNIDDMTGEDIGYVQELLLESGALDAFTSPVCMKKSRPAVLLTCLCRPEQRDEMLKLIFRHTSTIGVREHSCSRYALTRRTEKVMTSLGEVRVKTSSGFGVERSKPEFDDIARIARENGLSLGDVREVIRGDEG